MSAHTDATKDHPASGSPEPHKGDQNDQLAGIEHVGQKHDSKGKPGGLGDKSGQGGQNGQGGHHGTGRGQ